MATVAGANQMMAPPVLEGIAENGSGVLLGGFHGKVLEFAGHLDEFKKKFGLMDEVAQFEIEGHVLFMATRNFLLKSPDNVAVFRREPHKFFQDLPKFLYSLSTDSISGISVSGSLGVVSLLVHFHRA